jgi:hypothetical protein
MISACRSRGEKINTYTVLVGKPERNGPLGRHRRRYEGNIEMNLEQLIVEKVD